MGFPSDDHPVTIRWTTTTQEEHCLTLPYWELREAVDDERTRLGRAHHLDLTGDLDLLEQSWLADYEDSGSLGDLDRTVQSHDLPALPQLPVFTVSLDDAIGDEDECAHTYVLHAPDQQTARAFALAFHAGFHLRGADPEIDAEESGSVRVLEGQWWTFPGAPSWPGALSGRTWMDLRGDKQMLKRAYLATAGS